ncbi:MAG: hypothetical protein GX824_08840 [Clostridiales bacterium]|jgi:hypothetical protein|nr:hypothetical protein [Clostridiales bacterium]
MAKKHMKRIDPENPKRTQKNHWQNLPDNEVEPVPEVRGKVKSGKKRADED